MKEPELGSKSLSFVLLVSCIANGVIGSRGALWAWFPRPDFVWVLRHRGAGCITVGMGHIDAIMDFQRQWIRVKRR